MRFVKLRAPLVAVVCLTCAASNAHAQPTRELGPEETTYYIYCDWMSGPREKSLTQIEEVKWRDSVNTEADGSKWIGPHIGTYLVELADRIEDKTGARYSDCRAEPLPRYRFYTPGSTYSGSRGEAISVVLQKVDPSWFVIKYMSDNAKIVSLGAERQAAVPDSPSPSRPKPKSAPAIIVSGVEPIKSLPPPPPKPAPPLMVEVPKPPPAPIICNAPEGVSCVLPQ